MTTFLALLTLLILAALFTLLAALGWWDMVWLLGLGLWVAWRRSDEPEDGGALRWEERSWSPRD